MRHTLTLPLCSVLNLFLSLSLPLSLTGLQPPRSSSRSDSDLRPSSHGQVIDCVTTPWGPWSECSRTCGKGQKTRMREIKIYPENGGRECPNKLIQKRRCKGNPPCREYSNLNYSSSWTHTPTNRPFLLLSVYLLSLSLVNLSSASSAAQWTQ